MNKLKNGGVYVCSVDNKCNKSINTDPDGVAVVKTKINILVGKNYLGCR